ncbi:MAG TPA: hypothetical protein VGM76_12565 [Lacipirellulaceae bacterium]|jgi:hypothetical protein
MRFRKLRIAWSVLWGITGVLFCVIWVHTIHKSDKAAAWISDSYYFYGDAFQNWMEVSIAKPKPQPAPLFRMNYPGYYYSNFVANPTPLTPPIHEWHIAASTAFGTPGVEIRMPIWLGVVSSVLLAAISWLPWWSNRFSLRTLLIATTLIAVAMGLIAWLTK